MLAAQTKLTELSDYQLWQAKQQDEQGKAFTTKALTLLISAQTLAQKDGLSLSYEDAVRLVGYELLHILHSQTKVRICREAPPYVVYVYTD